MHRLSEFLLFTLCYLGIYIWTVIGTHMGLRDCFEYKKGNSRKKKECKQLTRTQKFLMLPVPTQFEIYAPFHLRVFRVLIVVNMFSILAATIVIALMVWDYIPRQGFFLFQKIRAFLLDIPMLIYTRVFWNRKKASFDFTDCKRP